MPSDSTPQRVVDCSRDSATDGRDPVADTQNAYVTLLFNKYRGSLLRYLQKLVASPEDAAELVQESYFRLLRQGNTIQLEAMARAYLFQTATNLARDHLRRRITRHADQHVALDETEIDERLRDPEHEVVWRQAVLAIETGIQELPEITRHVFVLSRFRHLSYPEIALRLGISMRTVQRRMAEAIAHLSRRVGGAL